MKTFVLAASWWCDNDVQMNIIKANSKEDAYRSFINEHYQDVFGEDTIWNEEKNSIDDCFAMMGVTCGIVEVP